MQLCERTELNKLCLLSKWNKSAKLFFEILLDFALSGLYASSLQISSQWPVLFPKYSYICTQNRKTDDCQNSNFCVHNACCAILYMHPLHIVSVMVHTPGALQLSRDVRQG